MKMERLREITEKLGAHSHGERINITFLAGTDKLWLSVMSSSEEKFEKIQSIIDGYSEEFLVIEHHRIPDPRLDWEYLNQVDFYNLYELMVLGIEADIKTLISNPPPHPIYAFVVGTSPEHYSMESFANTEQEWMARKKSYEKSGSSIDDSAKYWSPEFGLSHTFAGIEPWRPMYEALELIEKVASEHYDKTQGNGSFNTIYETRFTKLAVQALKANMYLFNDVSTTEDFVSYIQDPTGNGDEIYAMMETVPIGRVREIYGKDLDRKLQ